MKASLIIATLNEEENLADCLDSLRSQEGVLFEIIVADGKSTDRTLDIANALADLVVIEPKRTIAAGRQAGAKAAQGEYLVFCDADTHYPSGWLSELLAPFSDPDVSCTQGKLLIQDATSLESAVAHHVAPLYFKAALKAGVPSGAGANLAVRKDAFFQVGGFNTDLVTAEDVDLQRRLLSRGRNVFVDTAAAYVSPRRIRAWGYPKYVGFHVKNLVRSAVGLPPKEIYEPIR